MQLRNTNPDGKGESNLAKNLRSEINRTVPELDMMMLFDKRPRSLRAHSRPAWIGRAG
jgi:hypothetical protein